VLGRETHFDIGIMVLLLKKYGAQPAGPQACIAIVIQWVMNEVMVDISDSSHII